MTKNLRASLLALSPLFSEAEAEDSNRARPYKVCGGLTKERKGIVARSFQELLEKARKKYMG